MAFPWLFISLSTAGLMEMELMGSLVGVSVIMARKHFDSEGMSLMQGRAIASDPMQSVPTWMEAAVALALLGPCQAL